MEEALQPTARASSQPVGRRGQRWPGRSTRGNEGLSSQLWVRWETRPFKQDNCPCSWPPDIRSAFFQCHSLMASSFQNMQSPADLSNHEFHRVSSLGWSKHQDGFKASGHPIPPRQHIQMEASPHNCAWVRGKEGGNRMGWKQALANFRSHDPSPQPACMLENGWR